ncbi:MAG: ribosomal protein S18-alanine N-acetyltransferase [Thermincola sp.]|jgi:ribosomal-protein-alanine N-acetyltransferase|nr:ribosomal protein S18-alanine N-acetyltransferase [Thermincola sp.]MDT3704548.1 ribosomal protein S18-alanine N-acetyltransferase [Thermincola sp.]
MNEQLQISFENMEIKHLSAVVDIEHYSFPTPWSREAYFHEIAGNDFAYYTVALLDGKVVGYCGMWIILDEAHITTIAAHPAYRGRGLGAQLLYRLISEAGRRGCSRMTLEVRPSNDHALRLYTKTGFVSHGLRPGYYTDTGEDAIIMWMDLYK